MLTRLNQHALRPLAKWFYLYLPLPIELKRYVWYRLVILKHLFDYKQPSVHIQDINKILPTGSDISELLHSIKLAVDTSSPKISIIIPCYDQIAYTLHCLKSISDNPPAQSYEIIVVNDASPHDDYSILHNIEGISIVHNDSNLGYLQSCNKALRTARGEFIYLINNDIMVLPGAIDSLYNTFRYYPNAGLVGSKLIFANGLLQEAGGIIWHDGSAWNFGRNGNPLRPEFNYLRLVDYCSAASIMLPRSLFMRLEGFDPLYTPAYYEDTDLAMRVRQSGFDVIYQPLSSVIHFEGVSHGKNITKGLKQYQIANQSKFYNRWQAALAQHRSNGNKPSQEKDRRCARRVLLIDHCTPTPDRDAGSVVLLNLMLILRYLGFQPTFIPDSNYSNQPFYTSLCQSLGIECLYAPFTFGLKHHLSRVGDRYDLVILFRPDVAARYLPIIRKRCSRAKVIYYPHDLHYLRLKREADLRQDVGLHKLSKKSREIELQNVFNSDCTIVVSEAELDELTKLAPLSSVELLPLIANDHYGARPSPVFGDCNICFIGSFSHPPNKDAVIWFANEIFPSIKKRLPAAHFHIIGSNPPSAFSYLPLDGITIHGFVADLDALLSKMNVSVVPLRFGAGMKGKIVSAMRCGLPVVSSPIGSEGMHLTSGQNILVAGNPDAFADSVVEVLSSKEVWSRLSVNGLAHCSLHWGREAAVSKLESILSRLSLASSPIGDIADFPLYPFSL